MILNSRGGRTTCPSNRRQSIHGSHRKTISNGCCRVFEMRRASSRLSSQTNRSASSAAPIDSTAATPRMLREMAASLTTRLIPTSVHTQMPASSSSAALLAIREGSLLSPHQLCGKKSATATLVSDWSCRAVSGTCSSRKFGDPGRVSHVIRPNSTDGQAPGAGPVPIGSGANHNRWSGSSSAPGDAAK